MCDLIALVLRAVRPCLQGGSHAHYLLLGRAPPLRHTCGVPGLCVCFWLSLCAFVDVLFCFFYVLRAVAVLCRRRPFPTNVFYSVLLPPLPLPPPSSHRQTQRARVQEITHRHRFEIEVRYRTVHSRLDQILIFFFLFSCCGSPPAWLDLLFVFPLGGSFFSFFSLPGPWSRREAFAKVHKHGYISRFCLFGGVYFVFLLVVCFRHEVLVKALNMAAFLVLASWGRSCIAPGESDD